MTNVKSIRPMAEDGALGEGAAVGWAVEVAHGAEALDAASGASSNEFLSVEFSTAIS